MKSIFSIFLNNSYFKLTNATFLDPTRRDLYNRAKKVAQNYESKNYVPALLASAYAVGLSAERRAGLPKKLLKRTTSHIFRDTQF